jgi:hypothetical protein
MPDSTLTQSGTIRHLHPKGQLILSLVNDIEPGGSFLLV